MTTPTQKQAAPLKSASITSMPSAMLSMKPIRLSASSQIMAKT